MADQIPPNQAPVFVAAIPTPTLGTGGSGSVVFSTAIAATPARCLEIVLNPTTYPSWNKWVPRVVVTSASPTSAPSVLPESLAQLATSQQLLVPGTKFCFEVHMDPDSASFRKTDLEVTVLEAFEEQQRGGSDGEHGDSRKGWRVVWKTQGDPWYLRAERVQEFLEDGAGGCLYTNYETFHGPLTFAVKTFVGKQLMAGLTLWMNGLKAAAEATS
ncbi:hypothetical protein PFICI_09715 [Pestalotiopsis fici W106-1]|uniref:Coenzyme Q-binding protein COQ10 START domain-containing protein n=1 Tax=Pestalotiopsis fici (strain W106-1 / CGMCC3.15140) TaxID=1229662 RepID=W3WUV4_PESFW|nr:uncharacterized protein PFICI_09715 [Pestalotiopsis fici W106-1]ETS77653.1 hypothetical protein PFICI_09715 [Pestalotiopsis fici W106-1]